MPVTGNFTSVTLGPDDSGKDKLKVNGSSEDPDRVAAIYVAVAHASAQRKLLGAGNEPASLPAAAVSRPDGAGFWTTILDQDKDDPYVVGDSVLVVGVMVDHKDGSPSFWQQTLTVKSDEEG